MIDPLSPRGCALLALALLLASLSTLVALSR